MLPTLRFAALFAIVFPSAVFADLTQTATLSTSGPANLNFDTGATSNSGGDITFSSAGITPVGSAKAINYGIATPQSIAGFAALTVQLFPGYSTATIGTATLDQVSGPFTDAFFVHTNGGHYAKVLVTASTASSITLAFTTFGVSGSSGGGGAPTITAIRNNSSNIFAGLPNYGIAPSSIFVIIGSGLADAGTPVLQSSAAPGLPLTLNGASISATVGGVTVHPAIYYTSPDQIAAVLPATTPVGTGTLTVTYKGTASNAQPLVVVPAALGINTFYTNSAVATDALTGALITYTNSATAGEILTLWTTGLGADPADSDTTYSMTPHAVNTPLQIYFGPTQATILYQGSAGFPGVDQINVVVPPSSPDACFLTVTAVAGGVVSNVTTIPITASGGACTEPVSGLSGNQITPASQSFRTGFVALIQGTSPSAGTSTTTTGSFQKYMGIYSPPNPLSPGGCIVNNLTPAGLGTFTGLDPGTISLTGPGISLTLANQLGIKGAFIGTPAAGAIPQSGGTYTFQGGGGTDVGQFTSTLSFANPLLSWTNVASLGTVQRSQGFTATWSGGNPGSYVFITGTSTSTGNSAIAAGFTCLANSGDGKFDVPGYILSAIPAGKGGMLIQNDFYAPLQTTGVDISFAQGTITINSGATTFQ